LLGLRSDGLSENGIRSVWTIEWLSSRDVRGPFPVATAASLLGARR
jgi:hypothetical protein